MAITTHIEELECWQEARQLTKLIFLACETGRLSRDFGMANQLKRIAISVMSSIADASGRMSSNDMIRCLDEAQGSSMALKSMTYVLEDLEYLPMNYLDGIRTRTDRVKKSIRVFIRRCEGHARTSTMVP